MSTDWLTVSVPPAAGLAAAGAAWVGAGAARRGPSAGPRPSPGSGPGSARRRPAWRPRLASQARPASQAQQAWQARRAVSRPPAPRYQTSRPARSRREPGNRAGSSGRSFGSASSSLSVQIGRGAGSIRATHRRFNRAVVTSLPPSDLFGSLIPILSDHAAIVEGCGSEAMAALIQSQPQRRRTRGGSASSSSRKAWTSATLASRVA